MIYLDVIFNKFYVPLEFIFFQELFLRQELNRPCTVPDEIKLFSF